MDKKGALVWHWPEYLFVLLLVLGLVLAFSVPSPQLNYIIIAIAGIMFGRIVYLQRKKRLFPYYIIAIGFLLGYVIGSVNADRKIVIFVFILGTVGSYYAHQKKLIR